MADATHREKLLAFGGVLAVLFLSSLNLTVVGTALPRIIAELEGFDLYAWAFTSFSLASTVTLPIYGRISDAIGRRPVLLFGIVSFTTASVLTGLSQSMLQLVVFRAVQGLGGGALISMTWAAIGDIFTPRERGRYQGLTGAVFGVSSVIGPLIGGLFTDTIGWRWVFFVNVPVALAAYEVVRRYLPKSVRRPGSGIDLAGTVFLVAGTVPLLLALTWAGTTRPWGDPVVIWAFAGSAVALAAFVVTQIRSSHPTLDPAAFRDPTYALANAAAFLTGIGLFGAIIYLPLYIQGVQGGSAAASGFVLAPLMIGVVVGSTVSGWLASRTGRYRRWIAMGIAFMTVGFVLAAQFGPSTSTWVVVAVMVVLGAGIGPTNSLLTLAVQNALPIAQLGVATGANQFFRQIGGTLGVTVFGTMVAGHVRNGLPGLLPGGGEGLPAGLASTLSDPNLLTDPVRLARVRATVEPLLDEGAFETFLASLRALLGTGLSEVFLVGAAVSLVALGLAACMPSAALQDTVVAPERSSASTS
ncbi:MAG: MDR family MFS transporter [Trueperaceae bacterium]|nr:MDR family MFS transporter [Trueperaceae bacterium]